MDQEDKRITPQASPFRNNRGGSPDAKNILSSSRKSKLSDPPTYRDMVSEENDAEIKAGVPNQNNALKSKVGGSTQMPLKKSLNQSPLEKPLNFGNKKSQAPLLGADDESQDSDRIASAAPINIKKNQSYVSIAKRD